MTDRTSQARPVGIKIVAALLVLTGLLNAFAGIGDTDVSQVLGTIRVVTALAIVVVGVGCFLLQRWARVGAIALMALNALGLIWIWVQYSDRIIVSRVAWPLAINVFVIGYLLTPRVAAAFPERPRRTTAARQTFPWLPVLGGVAVILLITVVILTFDAGGGDAPNQFGEPTITGAALPTFDDSATDPAAGMAAPEVAGADFDGAPVSITSDGRPKIIIFLAHWCSVCQAEVPVVQDWLDAGLKPDGVDFYSVATSVAETRPNYPPSAWLESEGWTPPVLLDDTAYAVGDVFGLNAFPFWVFVNADGTVAGRLTGALPAEAITQLAESLLDG